MTFVSKKADPGADCIKAPNRPGRVHTPDPEEVLATAHQVLLDEYLTRSKATKLCGRPTRYVDKKGNAKYSDKTVISFRSAVKAKTEIHAKISIVAIAKMHGLSPSYGNALNQDYSVRSDCLPDENLVAAFKEKFYDGHAAVRTAKNKKWNNYQEGKRRVERRDKAMRWMDLRRTFKQCFSEFPRNGIDALIMVQSLVHERMFTIDQAHEAIVLIQEHMLWFSELREHHQPPQDQANNEGDRDAT